MADDNKYAKGTFCWIELGTTDSAAAKAFYTEIFPWTYDEHPMPDGEAYTMASVGDNQVAGLYTMPDEMVQANIPPYWMSYVSVEDADAMAAKVKELGGTVMKDPFDVMEMGRMAVCQDPTGAPFSLWQPAKHEGSAPKEFAPGYPCWNELLTTDVDKSREFFTALFGWEADKKEMGGMPYTIFKQGEEQVGGMMPINPEMGEMPSCWVIYVLVDDFDARLAKATAAGGKALTPPMEMPDIGRFTLLQDPQGAVLGVLAPPQKG